MPDEPDMRGKLVVFDPAVFNRTKTQLKDLDANRSEWNDVYGKFKTDWEAGQPAAEGRAKQETSFLDKFYDGSFSNYLSGLRARESDARRAAGDRALEYARGATDRASMLRGEPTGTSSATRAMAYRLGKDINTEVALGDIARERGDFDYINKGQAAFAGARTGLMDAVTKRQLLPHQLSDQELMYAVNALRGIQATRLGAASPVFWRERGDLEKAADVMDSFATSAYKGANAFTTFSGMGGGMGGGGGASKPAGDEGFSQFMQEGNVSAEANGSGMRSFSSPQSGGGTFNYSAPHEPSAEHWDGESGYRSPNVPNYSPGNDPNFWQNYNGRQTFG